ncbi:MAG: choice-of-anchor Q domain-containing protein [Cyanobacteria bacterium P01_F01_bin.153]
MATFVVTTTADVVNAGDGVLSLREAITNAATGDTIILGTGEYTLTQAGTNEDGNLQGDLDIVGKSITIQGTNANSTFIQAGTTDTLTDSVDRVFDIQLGAGLTLDNLTVRRGSTVDVGGGIRSQGNVNITNVAIAGNRSLSGGAIAFQSAATTLTNVTLSANTAVDYGGAIYNRDGTFTLTNATITNNAVDSFGAGIHSRQSTGAIINSTITSNIANGVSGTGGGLSSDLSTLTLADATVTNNSASARGGGVAATNSTLIWSQSTISGNTATAEGGGLHAEDSTVTLNNSQLSNNAGLTAGGGALLRRSTVNLAASLVQANSSATGGGFFVSNNSSLSLDNSSIRTNTASQAGGLYINVSTVNIKQSTVSANSAGNGAGAFQNNGSTLQIEQSTIDSNGATANGGGLFVRNGSDLDVTNSTIANNAAAVSGGAVYVTDPGSNATLKNTTVSGNTSSPSGSGLFAGTSATINLFNSIAANSTDGSVDIPDALIFGGTIEGSDRNLVEDDPSGAVGGTGALLTGDPLLGPLANNGGPTPTLALLSGSPAINQSTNLPEPIDQRGAPAVGIRDLGAFESIFTAEIELLGFGDNPSTPGVAIPNNSGSPSTINGTDFGELDTTSGSRTNTFEIQNLSGGENLQLTGISEVVIAGAHADDFIVTTVPSSTIAPLSQSQFAITFNPSNGGLRTATVAIANNDSDESNFLFALQGTGTGTITSTPPPPIEESSTAANLQVQSDGVTLLNGGKPLALRAGFGQTAEELLQITNTGGGSLNLSQIILPSGFSLVDANGLPITSSTLLPGATLNLTLQLTGDRLEPRTGTVQILSNDPDTPNFSLPITGAIQFTPQSPRTVDFFLPRLELPPVAIAPDSIRRPGQRVIIAPSTTADTTIVGEATRDNLFGLGGNDNLVGLGGNDVLNGYQGADNLEGGDGDDYLFGGSGDDRISAGAGNDLARGNQGSDRITGDDGADLLLGDSDNDLVDGADGDDVILGGAGIDSLAGAAGNDLIQGGDGADLLAGDGGEDQLFGEEGSDRLDGGAGNDALDGGAGNDILFGGDGSDRLAGGDGDDILIGGLEEDVLTGGDGRDQFWVDIDPLIEQNLSEIDTVVDFEDGVDLIAIAGLSPVDELSWGDRDGGVGIFVNGNPVLQLNSPTILDSSNISAADFVV